MRRVRHWGTTLSMANIKPRSRGIDPFSHDKHVRLSRSHSFLARNVVSLRQIGQNPAISYWQARKTEATNGSFRVSLKPKGLSIELPDWKRATCILMLLFS
jgi:hypothetical protein